MDYPRDVSPDELSDLGERIGELRTPATPGELDEIKRNAMARAARRPSKGTLMRPRATVTLLCILGLAFTAIGAGLAVTDYRTVDTNAAGDQYGGGGTGGANNGQDDVNCGNFDSQDEANDFYDRQGGLAGGDEDNLDPDEDGVACEDYDYSDAGAGGDDDDGDGDGDGFGDGTGSGAISDGRYGDGYGDGSGDGNGAGSGGSGSSGIPLAITGLPALLLGGLGIAMFGTGIFAYRRSRD